MKKIISILLTLAIMLTIIPISAAGNPADFANRCGDVDGNGLVNISDALEILMYLAGLDNAIDNNPRAAGAAILAQPRNRTLPNINDALIILMRLAGMNTVFASMLCSETAYCPRCSPYSQSMENSKTKAAFDLLLTDTYYVEMMWEFDFFGVETIEMKMLRARRGDDYRLNMDINMAGESWDFLILGSMIHIFDHDAKTASFYEASEQEKAKFIADLEFIFGLAEAVEDISGLMLTGTGTGSFKGRDNLFYEELYDFEDDNLARIYFDGDDMVGMFDVGYDMELVLFISATPAASLFEIPEDYTKIEISQEDYLKIFA
jgi:hypothetical protein